jgi:PAS domain S-box-containing protein
MSDASESRKQRPEEEALHETEEQLRLLLENMEDVVSRHLPDSTFIYVSPSCQALMGYAPEELIQTRAADYVHPDDVQAILAAIDEAVERHEGHYRVQHRMKRKDGGYVWVETAGRLLYGPNGHLSEIQCIARDITERKRVEEALIRSETLLRETFNAMPDLLTVHDRDLNVVISNWKGHEFVPVEQRDQHLKCYAVYMHRDTPCEPCHATEVFKTGKPKRVEKTNPVDGVSREINVYPVRNETGEVTMVTEHVRDITERKRAEEERQAHVRILECLDQINRPIREAADVEQLLWDTVRMTLSMFNCDRTFLLYPCDPDAPTCRVPVEVTRKGYPGACELNLDIPMKPGLGDACRTLLASDGPVTFGRGCDHPLYEEMTEQFGVQSQIVVGVYPRVGKPWVLGLHQCSYARVWTLEERRLLNEIARRIGDGLTSALAQRELRESEERYRAIAEDMPVLICRFLPDGEITYVNQAYCRCFRESSEELVGRTFLSLIPEADREAVMDGISALTAESPTQSHEHRVIAPDGEIRWQRWTNRALFDTQGNAVAFQSIGEDITDRKRAEEELRESEERFRTLFENAPLGYQSLDRNGNFVELNETWCKLLGYTKEEVLGRNFSEFVHPDFKESFKASFPKFQNTGYILGLEFEMIKKDGSEVIVAFDGRIGRHDDGSFKQTHCVFSDITKRKQAEEALRLSEERFRIIFEQAAVGVAQIVSRTGNFMRINQKYADIIGYTVEELEHLTFQEITHPFDLQRDLDNMQRLLDGEIREFSMEKRYYHKNGSIVWVDLAVSPMWRLGEEPTCHIAVVEDITERKRVEEEREELIAKLEAQNAELERFTYTVSHDLKSPLITIKGFVGMLRQDLPEADSGPVGDDLARISNAADKMDHLLKDLLELSRIGRLVNPPEDVSLEELAHEARELVHGQADEAGVQVVISPGLPTVLGDRIRLLEVLQNLIDNAVKHMGEQSRPRIEVGSRRDGNQTICYVRDNGIGIDTRYHEKIFGLFDQLDPNVDGTGIGLALAKRIIEVHGGRIWVESEGLGRGSTFCFAIETQAQSPESEGPTGAEIAR